MLNYFMPLDSIFSHFSSDTISSFCDANLLRMPDLLKLRSRPSYAATLGRGILSPNSMKQSLCDSAPSLLFALTSQFIFPTAETLQVNFFRSPFGERVQHLTENGAGLPAAVQSTISTSHSGIALQAQSAAQCFSGRHLSLPRVAGS